MARRGAPPPSARGARGAPPHLVAGNDDDDAGVFARFVRDELTAPDKLPGNISVAAALALFFGGVWGVRTFGELMVPA
jgi:hypothetical protein